MGQWKSKKYLTGSQPGDLAVFDVEIGRTGAVHYMYWMGTNIGLGRAKVWLDGEKETGSSYIFGDYMGRAGAESFGNRPV